MLHPPTAVGKPRATPALHRGVCVCNMCLIKFKTSYPFPCITPSTSFSMYLYRPCYLPNTPLSLLNNDSTTLRLPACCLRLPDLYYRHGTSSEITAPSVRFVRWRIRAYFPQGLQRIRLLDLTINSDIFDHTKPQN